MRRAWIFAWGWTIGAVLAAASADAQTARNATTVSRLPACNLARQGWWMSVNDAAPDCQTGSGTAGSGYAICQCDPVLGWLTYEPGGGYVQGATVGGGLELSGVNLGLMTSCANGQVLKWTAAGPAWGCADVAAGSGTVTSVAVTTSAGVSATVANATTTPNLTFTLGAITPSSVAASGAVTGSNLSGTNTGDQTTITGNAGTATALAANGTNCSAGQAATGTDASGNAEGCAAFGTIGGTVGSTADQVPTATSGGILQASTVKINSSGYLILPASGRITGADSFVRLWPGGSSSDSGINLGPSGTDPVSGFLSDATATTGSLRVPTGRAGTASIPTYTFYGDEDTGFYRSAVNTVSGAAGGSESLRLTSDRVGAVKSFQALCLAAAPYTCDAAAMGAWYCDSTGSGTFCDCLGSGWINRYPAQSGSDCS